MNRPLKITLKVLATTRNEAAASVLTAALDASEEVIQLGALQSLLARRSPAGHRELIARWHTMPPGWKPVIVENPGQLTVAIRNAILSADEQLCANGCDAALCMAEYDLMPALVKVAEAEASSCADVAAYTLRELAQLLCDELARPHDQRQRRAPQLFRTHVVSTLEASVGRFSRHGRREIVEAFLMLTGRESATLKRVLQDPLDKAHVPMTEILTYSPRTGIVRLLLSFLEDLRAPQAALQVLSQRDDDEFVRKTLRKVGAEPTSGVRVNLRRMRDVVWMKKRLRRVKWLNDEEQVALAEAAVCSGLPLAAKLTALRNLRELGGPAGRKAAVDAVTEMHGVDANRLVLAALRDEDPNVQAAALKQIRVRGLPGAMATLIDALNSPHEVVVEAARSGLNEFNRRRFLTAFDSLSEQARRHTGELVKKVDVSAAAQLTEEMQTPSRVRRLRAIEVAVALGMVEQIESALHERLRDPDHMVRVAAVEALAAVPTDQTRRALREAVLDGSVAVRLAAERAMDEMALAVPRAPAQIDIGAIGALAQGPQPIAGGR